MHDGKRRHRLSQKKRILIFNADDFGRHPLVNRSVEEGVKRGFLRSASIMPGEPFFDDAIQLAKRCPKLGVGVHLTLVNGKPVLPAEEIPSLVTAHGRFYEDYKSFIKAYLTNRIRLADIFRELGAQLDKVIAAGIIPTHADSHEHLHVMPGIFPTVLDLLETRNIRRVRIPKIFGFRKDFLTVGPGAAVGRLGLWNLSTWGKWTARRRGFGVPDYFAGKIGDSAADEGFLIRLCEEIPPGVTEVMLHPGLDNASLAKDSGWHHDYEAEYKAICSPALMERLSAAGITVGNYSVIDEYC